MRSYSELTVFDDRERRLFHLATELVSELPTYEFSPGELLRCHELARAVGKALGLPFCDGRFGFVEHSWLWIPKEGKAFDGFRPGHKWQLPPILDVYVPGAMPQVQLIDASSSGLPARYVYGNPRTDINETVVDVVFCKLKAFLGDSPNSPAPADVLEVVTEQMWCSKAETDVAARFGVPIEEAIRLVDEAIRSGFLETVLGQVRPSPEPRS
jgi:hypothetical protein